MLFWGMHKRFNTLMLKMQYLNEIVRHKTQKKHGSV